MSIAKEEKSESPEGIDDSMDSGIVRDVESFNSIAFKILFLQIYAFQEHYPNFMILYKIRRYVDSPLEESYEGSIMEHIAKDINEVKKVKDDLQNEIIHAWMQLWTTFCKVDFMPQRNEFILTAREPLLKGDNLGMLSFILDDTLVGPIVQCRWSTTPNAKPILQGNKIQFVATTTILKGEIITFPKSVLFPRQLDKDAIIVYTACNLCHNTLSPLIKDMLPQFTKNGRDSFIKSKLNTDMEKKVFDELFTAFEKMNWCYRCVVHRCTFFVEYPTRNRVVLSNEVTFQSWAFSKLFTLENTTTKNKIKQDLSYAYVSDDERSTYHFKHPFNANSDDSKDSVQLKKSKVKRKKIKRKMKESIVKETTQSVQDLKENNEHGISQVFDDSE